MAALETDTITTVAIGTEQNVGSYTVPAGITRVSVRVYLEDLVSSAQTLTARITNTPSGESEATEAFYSTGKHTAANTAFILSFYGIDVETADVVKVYVTSSVADTVSGHCKFFDNGPAAIADAVCDEILSGHTTAGTLSKAISDILVDTAVIGALGAGLTGIPWNASWDAEVQSEVQDALDANNLANFTSLTFLPAVAADESISIIRGDDYNNTDSNALTWTEANYAGPSLTSATSKFRFTHMRSWLSDSEVAELEVTGTAALDGTDGVYKIELTSTQTTALDPGEYHYDLEVIYSSTRIITRASGTMTVLADVQAIPAP